MHVFNNLEEDVEALNAFYFNTVEKSNKREKKAQGLLKRIT